MLQSILNLQVLGAVVLVVVIALSLRYMIRRVKDAGTRTVKSQFQNLFTKKANSP